MDENERVKLKYELLMSEIQECREDERNELNRIVQIIVAVGTIISVLFGTSLFSGNNSSVVLSIIMIMSVFVFGAALTYILSLGMLATLRYYHVKETENQLRGILDKYQNRTDFILWDELRSSIVTRNWKHLGSYHSGLYYTYTSMAILFSILFCAGVQFIQFYRLTPKQWFDYLFYGIVMALLLGVIISFFLISKRGERMYYYAFRNSQSRVTGDNKRFTDVRKAFIDSSKRQVRKVLYYVYPKTQDLQKPLLIIFGVYGGYCISQKAWDWTDAKRVILGFFIFEVLMYQARYHINDIRGFYGDQIQGYGNRIPVDADDKKRTKRAINLAFLVAIIKVSAGCVLLCFWDSQTREMFEFFLGALVVITIIYETLRSVKATWLVLILVGAGYPLRLLFGMFLIVGDSLFTEKCFIIALCLSMWGCGCFASMLVWADEIICFKRKKRKTDDFGKAHYKVLYKHLKSVIYVDKPLRTKDNNNSRPWDIAFAVSFGIVMFYEIFTGEWPELACVGIVAVALIYIGVCQENKAIKGFMVMGMVLLLIKLIIHLILGESIVSKTVFVDWNQMLILFVYFWLRYQPQMMPFSAFLKKAEVLRRLIYGKETWGHYFE